MKKLFLLAWIVSNSAQFFAQKEETISTGFYDFESWGQDWGEPLKEAYIFADACKLRSGPTSGSEMLAKLLIGDRVKVVSVSDIDTTINGLKSKWIQVESGKKRGYVWGGLLTNQVLKISDTTFAVWGVSKIVKISDTVADQYFASVRIFSRKQVAKRVDFEVTYGGNPAHGELIMIKNPLIDGVKHVFIYNTFSGACGVSWSDHFLLETESGIDYLGAGHGMSDGGVFYSSTEFAFPTLEKEDDYTIPYQRKPDRNQILKITDNGEYDENCIWVEHSTVETFEWKEGALVPFCRE
jgi:hypothetical protein